MNQPEPNRIENFSPTLINDLETCGYKVAFDRDSKFKSTKISSTRLVVGQIVHETIKRVGKGELDNIVDADLKDSIRQLWDKVAEEKERELSQTWESTSVPARAKWREYSNLKINTVNSLHRTITTFRQSTSYGNKRPQVEKYLKDPLIGLDGIPDRVEFRADGPHVVDIKSNNKDLTIKESWKRQTLLYAHLVAVNGSETPVAIAIESADGERITEKISSNQIQVALDEAIQRVEHFNDNLETSTELANPTRDNCQYCPYRPLCQPFWEAVHRDWSKFNVRGNIVRAQSSNGKMMITLRPTAPDWPVTEVHISKFEGEFPQGVETVAIVDGGWGANASSLVMEWNTLVAFGYSAD